MDTVTVLEKYGLARSEAKVYLALLDLGPSLAGKIARKAGMHRRNVYDTTDRLVKKGLLAYIVKNNRRVFEPINPEQLLDRLKEKETSIQAILPELLGKYHGIRYREETNFYKGKRGLKTVFEDQLRVGKEILILGASTKAYEIMPFYFRWYDKRRVEKKIPARLIFPFSARKSIRKIPLAKIRFVADDDLGNVAFNVYGENVALILWNPEKLVSVLIRGKEISDAYRTIFEFYWGHARK